VRAKARPRRRDEIDDVELDDALVPFRGFARVPSTVSITDRRRSGFGRAITHPIARDDSPLFRHGGIDANVRPPYNLLFRRVLHFRQGLTPRAIPLGRCFERRSEAEGGGVSPAYGNPVIPRNLGTRDAGTTRDTLGVAAAPRDGYQPVGGTALISPLERGQRTDAISYGGEELVRGNQRSAGRAISRLVSRSRRERPRGTVEIDNAVRYRQPRSLDGGLIRGSEQRSLRNRADRRRGGLCPKTNGERERERERGRKGGGIMIQAEGAARGRSGGRQHRVTSAGPIFGSAKRKRNDRAVMHHGGARRKSSDRAHGGPIPVVPTHARIISADRAYLLPSDLFGLEQMRRRRRRRCHLHRRGARAAKRDAKRNRSAGEADSRQCRGKWIIALSRILVSRTLPLLRTK